MVPGPEVFSSTSLLVLSSVRSLQAELLAAKEASLRGGVRAGPAPRRHRPLPLPHGLPPAGGGPAHLPQRLPAGVEWQGPHLPR